MPQVKRIRVVNDSDVAKSVVEATRISKELGFSHHDTNKIATAVSELARNILKYAGSGEVKLSRVVEENRTGIKVVAADQGPGIADINLALSDHYSSGGTLGLGLPGIKRLMDEFDLESQPDKGTTVTCLKWKASGGRSSPSHLMRAVSRQSTLSRLPTSATQVIEVSRKEGLEGFGCAYCLRPCRGEIVSGDAVAIDQKDDLMLLAIIDGLGHGVEANKVALRAKRHIRTSWSANVIKTLTALHEILRGTIGAAVGIAVLERMTGKITYAALGNTAFRILGAHGRRCLATPGTVGLHIRTPQVHTIQLSDRDTVLLYTDGVSDRFELDHRQVRLTSPKALSASIVEQFGKLHDDATCIALRYRR